jgi:uncharacterized membrane protein YkoI
MNLKTIATIALILVIFGTGIAMARPNAVENNLWNSMMGSLNNGINGIMSSGMMSALNGNNMMGNGNNMMGNGNNMMGNGNGYSGMSYSGMIGSGMMGQSDVCGGSGTVAVLDDSTPITIDQAKSSVEDYLSITGNSDLEIAEVIEFNNHFYAGIKEKSTGKYAIELLVNRYTGSIFPEMGPNMMWNTKYGHMNWNALETATLTEEQAIETAQKYLDSALPGTEVEGADVFYGYYTLEVEKDGKVYGMLSVNANTGAIWYHTWHGTFVKILEVE